MKSMTGFGRGETVAEGWRFTVELTSVNRKQADLVFSLPRDASALETPLRQLIAPRITRGRVSVSLRIERAGGGNARVRIDVELARAFADGLRQLNDAIGGSATWQASDWLRAPGVFLLEESVPLGPERWPVVEQAATQALESLELSRATEGAALQKILHGHLTVLRGLLAQLTERAPHVPVYHRRALQRRLAEAGLPLPLDDERLIKEIAVFADRSDISEELARFGSHLDQCEAALHRDDPVGRPLDFLCQELHRELNTMGAKANDAAIAHLVVEGKCEVEKFREQVQNIE